MDTQPRGAHVRLTAHRDDELDQGMVRYCCCCCRVRMVPSPSGGTASTGYSVFTFSSNVYLEVQIYLLLQKLGNLGDIWFLVQYDFCTLVSPEDVLTAEQYYPVFSLFMTCTSKQVATARPAFFLSRCCCRFVLAFLLSSFLFSCYSFSVVLSRVDGAPKLGWHDTIAYLTIPLILVITQSVSMKIMQPAKDPNKPMDESQAASQNVSLF